jgi:hypothetical protein
MLRWDAFKPRYSPIRLNRKNRMVYFLRRDGTVASAPWEKTYFTAFRGVPPYTDVWGLKCILLDEDGRTIRDYFEFNHQDSYEGVQGLWEFIRRYMEEGPEAVADSVSYYIPIGRFGENPLYGFCRLLLNFNKSIGMQVFMAPLMLVFAIGRVISMLTGSNPKWPKEVEEACAVDPDDPWIRDSRNNKPLIPGIFSAIRRPAKDETNQG